MTHPLIPQLGFLKAYDTRAAVSDGVAGTILAILLIPQVMAYAQLAGLPPEAGLYGALVPPLLYALFGTSGFVSVGPVALISLVIAGAAGETGAQPLEAAAIVGIEAGVFLVAIGASRLGRLINFISEPVLLGFTAAVAILILTSQVPTLVGTDPERAGNLPDALAAFWQAVPNWQPVSAMIGGGAVILLFACSRYAAPLAWKLGIRPPWRQAVAKSLPLFIIIGCALAASQVEADIALVSAPPQGLPALTIPAFKADLWLGLLPSALVVAVIIFATATAVAKSLAGSDRRGFDTNREAVALGLGNIGASLTGGYAVSASLSRSALVEESGGRTALAHVVGAVWVLVTIVFFAPILAFLPKTALAALVISAIFGLIKLREMKRVWDHDRTEAALIAVAFFATIGFGVQIGLAAGALAGLAHYVWITSLPRVTRVASHDGGETFRSIDRDEISMNTLPALALRIDRSIYFANAAYVEDRIFERLANHDDIRAVIFDMRSVNGIDASGAAMFARLVERMTREDIAVHFAALHEPVRAQLDRLPQTKTSFHRSVNDALEACDCDL